MAKDPTLAEQAAAAKKARKVRVAGSRGRPPSPTTAAAKAIYFRDKQQITDLEDILKKHPRSSASSIVQQLLGSFVAAYKAGKMVDNKVEFTSAVYL